MESTGVALNSKLSALVQSIYQGAKDTPPDQFQDWALEQVKSVVEFDSAIWASGALLEGDLLIHSIQLHNQPPQMLENYARYEDKDVLRRMVMASPGTTVNPGELISREELEQSEIYLQHCKPYKMEHTLSTAILDHANGLFAGTSFYRANVNRPFTTQEKELKQFITPILTEARKLNLFIALNEPSNNMKSFSAICDLKGVLREAETSFPRMLQKQWPEWQGPELPICPEELMGNNSDAIFNGEKIIIYLQTWSDLVRVQVREKSVYDQLTPAEQQIIQHLITGLSNKKIAINLNISPKTVGHHLQSIYKKTNSTSRTQAIAKLRPDMPVT